MRRAWLLALAPLVLAAPARAAEPPERLLFAGTQVYLRWDGVAAHRAEYAQSAAGQLLANELNPLLRKLAAQYPEQLHNALVNEKVLAGTPPDRLVQIQADVTEAAKLLDVVFEHGVVVGVEVRPAPGLVGVAFGKLRTALTGQQQKEEPNPLIPTVQATVIVPDAAANWPAVRGGLRVLGVLNGAEKAALKESRIAGREVTHLTFGEAHLAGWVEGPHVVLSLGMQPPEKVIERLASGEPRIDTHPLFRRVSGFREFSTDGRGYIDVDGLIGIARPLLAATQPKLAHRIEQLGVDRVRSLTVYSGFDGPVRRGVYEVDLPSPRKGLGRAFGGPPLSLDDLPPLPTDVSRWSIHRIDPNAAYEALLNLAAVTGTVEDEDDTPPPGKPAVKTSAPTPAPTGAALTPPAKPTKPVEKETPAEQIDKALGISLKSDLIDHLGTRLVVYTTTSEGAFFFGQVMAIEVKDAGPVLEALDQIATGANFSTFRLRKRQFQGVQVRELYGRQRFNPVVPSYAVAGNWLVVGLYPQAVQGFVQRTTGDLPRWQPEPKVTEALAKLPKNACGLAVSDWRPSVQQALMFAPFFLEAVRGFNEERGGFEVGNLPTAQAVNHRLFPNVVVMTDDGKRLRWESRGSVLVPLDGVGLDPVTLVFASLIR
jgi:hypothetical protein